MATKVAMEAELRELRGAQSASELELAETKSALVASEKEVRSLSVEVTDLLARKSGGVEKDAKDSLDRLSDFLRRLYRESESPSVKKDIQDWRKLLSTLVE